MPAQPAPGCPMQHASALPGGTRRLYRLCVHLALGSSIWGYNIGVLSSVLVHPGWRAALGDPSPSTRGFITGAYYLGTLASYVLVAHPLADRLGRRRAAMLGTLVLCWGVVMMASAEGGRALVVLLWGRFICGVGVGVVSTSVPLHQSEVSPAHQRGKFVTLNHVGFVAGLAAGLWVGYGMTFWTASEAGRYWGWRVSMLVQLVPAIVFVTGLPFFPESPRWLIQQGQTERASRVLFSLRQGTTAPDLIARELDAMSSAVESSPRPPSGSFLAPSLFLFRSPSLWARLWRAFLLQFMAQMCGAAAIKYYLPTLLRALGLEYRLALMAGAVEMTAKLGMTVVEMGLIDRFGRTTCLAAGSIMMGFAMMINGLLPLVYPGNVSSLADAVCVAFIFIYAMGYSLGLGPAAWVYSSEIFPTNLRARGLNFAASGGSLGSILVSQIWPVGNARLGSGVYFVFMGINWLCVPIIYSLYPETKGLPLEDMDALFAKDHTSRSHAHATPDHTSGGNIGARRGEEEPLLVRR
ncbi:hypothetical protein E4U42_007311 [Claviceps africana]|uniref:Major facilitator superfamily (MFS) profile domain-containing protein n=1 Tax=Claviceps africana TaxID=83212 RepID=A0A8K0NG73_9HYPO|nr:hypothetical protein E4U42_007311 [Claviceps africana]